MDAVQHYEHVIMPPSSNSCMFVSRGDAMTYAIHASKNGQSVVTVRISPEAAVDKASLLESLGWQVHITDSPDTGSRCQIRRASLEQSKDCVTAGKSA